VLQQQVVLHRHAPKFQQIMSFPKNIAVAYPPIAADCRVEEVRTSAGVVSQSKRVPTIFPVYFALHCDRQWGRGQ
jgi:hypothetical protein